jgi:hypothetical protein
VSGVGPRILAERSQFSPIAYGAEGLIKFGNSTRQPRIGEMDGETEPILGGPFRYWPKTIVPSHIRKAKYVMPPRHILTWSPSEILV